MIDPVRVLLEFDLDEPEFAAALDAADMSLLERVRPRLHPHDLDRTDAVLVRMVELRSIPTPETPMDNTDNQDPGPLPSVGEMLAESASARAFVPEPAAGQVITMAEAADMRFDDQPEYDRERVVGECRAYMGQSAEAMLEAGRRLIALKEHEDHGEFLRIVQGDLNLPPRTAQVMMQAAAKYLGPALSGHKAQALAHLGKAKLFELMTEPDEDLADLADGGDLRGLALDDIARMTTRELKAALRAAKSDAESREAELKAQLDAAREVAGKQRERMDGRIQELEEALEIRKKSPPKADERVQAIRADLSREAEQIRCLIDAGLRRHILALRELDGVDWREQLPFIAGMLAEAERTINGLRGDFGIPTLLDGDPRPEAFR